MKTSIVLVGPRIKNERNLGGATVSFENLVKFLQNREEISLIVQDADFNHLGKIQKILAYLNLIFELIGLKKKTDYFFLNLSPLNLIFTSFLLSFFIDQKKIAIRFFGTNLDRYLNSTFLTALLKKNKNFKAIFLQTHGLVKRYNEKTAVGSNLFWLPTSREKPEVEIKTLEIKEGEALRFIFLGQVKSDKGIFVMKKAVEALPKNIRIKLSINIYGPLSSGVTKESIENDVISYKGFVINNDIYQIISLHHAMIFPSFYEGEGYPGAIIESFLSQRPVICSNFKYLPELVNENNGFLVPPQDHQKLKERLIDIINNPKLLVFRSEFLKYNKNVYESQYWNKKILDFFLKGIYSTKDAD